MTIEKIRDGAQLTIVLEGRLDAVTATELDAALKQSISGIEKLVIDIERLDYLASAGLRVLTSAQRTMKKQGEMIIAKPNETVREIFEVTGLEDIFNIQG